ncbi:potassium/sodium hyperpolarization-activated cyclic nucleotide-gated channel 1-like [Battus philenor]|uniref:potassium/sodium hyperpolarization-activated cyclic nucleotide-gated channel 1-like n=1 Tax=Battus philenor TaxID=42288 RepID=UPI0035D0AAB5
MLNSKHDGICTIPKPPIFLDLPPTASVFQRVLCKLRYQMLPCEWHHGTSAFLRSRKNLLLERRQQLSSGFSMIWHPYSPMKYYWDCIVGTLMFVVFIYMPFQVFVDCPNPSDPFILLCDAIAFIDIGSNFITGYTEEDHKRVVLRPGMIARNYLKGTFFIDLIAALPLQLYQIFDNCKYPTNTAMFIFKLPRLKSMERKWLNIQKQFELSYVTTVLISVLFRTVLFYHWMTYFHYQVPSICSHFYDMDRNWVKRFRGVRMPYNTVFKKYTANLYLACGLCIGAGYYTPIGVYVIPELLLTSFMGIMGLVFFIYCFTTVLRLVMYKQHESFLFYGKLRELEEYMSLKRLPKLLRKKIVLFLNYQFNGGYYNEELILKTINEQIKQDINMHCCKKLLDNVPIFNDMPIALMNTVIFSLTRVLYMPGETVVKGEEPLSCMYLICSGTVAVMNRTGKEIAHLRDGAFYGELTLLEPGVSHGTTIIALEITEIYTLTSGQFQACLMPYPHLRRRLAALLPRRHTIE